MLPRRSRTPSRRSVSRRTRRSPRVPSSSRPSTGDRTGSVRCSRSRPRSRRARPTRLDEFRAPLAAELLVRLGLADADTNLAEALDRWELALFQNEPFRSEQLRAALAAVLGTTWPLRAAVLLETDPDRRDALHQDLAALADGGEASPGAAGAVRRALVEVLRDGDRSALVVRLDRTLLGLASPGRLRVAS